MQRLDCSVKAASDLDLAAAVASLQSLQALPASVFPFGTIQRTVWCATANPFTPSSPILKNMPGFGHVAAMT